MPRPLREALGHPDSSRCSGEALRRSGAFLCAVVAFGAPIAAGASVAFVPAATPAPIGDTAPATRLDGHRSEIEAAWFQGGTDLVSRAVAARDSAVQLGAANVEAPARALIVAPGNKKVRLQRALLAASLAPDLPLVRMALAGAFLENGRYLDAVDEAAAGLAAIPRNLEATAWLAGSLLTMFATVLVVGSLLLIVWVGLFALAHAAHDLGDLLSSAMPNFARAALLGAALLVPVALGQGLLGTPVQSLLIGRTLGDGNIRRRWRGHGHVGTV